MIPSPEEFSRDVSRTIGRIQSTAHAIVEAYAELNDATLWLPGRGNERVTQSSQSTPVESVFLQFRSQRQALERTHERIVGSPAWWQGLYQNLVLAYASIEEGHVEDPSVWSAAEIREAERQSWQRRRMVKEA